MKIGLSSDKMSLIDLSMLARWTIRTRLMDVPGVANVAIWGERRSTTSSSIRRAWKPMASRSRG